ncbi:uroporphyrinogen-III synthase [Thermomonas carbonis]|uniref:Uroporphyrinogen-III synthase n=1 Tax=Thermomonas carbonis TaxID=1463158 RepID=A0A7G9SSK1_9GAMM|nr:uroporphyrinogen-III synthase [Thermomonas carbonis]QNN70826.1 uroporphyrinogen-III synthase [Thermomonas carbonis]GHC02679.1 uroporphyrinogen III methyltransferase [Thermomonas carbonis]
MTRRTTTAMALTGWTVVSLRPQGQHASLRAAAARVGAGVLALSPLAVETRIDTASRKALRETLATDIVLFTSPNAVLAASRVRGLRIARRQTVLAVGDGTRRALQRLGIEAIAPARMDSEGLLAVPALRDIAGRSIGLVTAPGGRNRIAPTLQARGADLIRADIYERTPITITVARWQALATVLAKPQHVVLALSSAEALDAMLRQHPADLAKPLRRIAVTAASERLAQAARDAGFRRIVLAGDARPASLLRAVVDAFV